VHEQPAWLLVFPATCSDRLLASTGHWTVGIWFNKAACTTSQWEYLYSHDDGITSGTILSNGNQNINFFMSCDDQIEGTFLRSVFLSDENKLVTFDWCDILLILQSLLDLC